MHAAFGRSKRIVYSPAVSKPGSIRRRLITVRTRSVAPTSSIADNAISVTTNADRTRCRLLFAVPDSAVMNTGTRSVVFVARGDGKFEPRQVTAGAKTQGFYEIRSGLSPGERVVVEPSRFFLETDKLRRTQHRGVGGDHRVREIVAGFLRRLERVGYYPFDRRLAVPDTLQSWRLAAAALFGRY